MSSKFNSFFTCGNLINNCCFLLTYQIIPLGWVIGRIRNIGLIGSNGDFY